MLPAALRSFHLYRQQVHDLNDRKGSLTDEMFIVVTTALLWACSVDEGFKKYREGDTYPAARDAHHYGRLILGVRWARNRAGHQRALVVDRSTGRRYPGTFPMRYRDFLWRPANELPEADRGHDYGRRTYVEHLQGRSALNTLDHIGQWFDIARERPAVQDLFEARETNRVPVLILAVADAQAELVIPLFWRGHGNPLRVPAIDITTTTGLAVADMPETTLTAVVTETPDGCLTVTGYQVAD